MKIRILTASLLVVAANCSHAIPVVFDLRDATRTVEIESGTITRGGVKAILTPSVSGNSGVLNQTAGHFGINATGTADESDQIDGDEGIESISIVFDTDVLFTRLVLSEFTTSEQALLSIGGFSAQTLIGTSAASDVYSFATHNLVTAGQTVVAKYSTGSGFSLDSFTIERATVSDAGNTALLLLAPLLGLFIVRRYRICVG